MVVVQLMSNGYPSMVKQVKTPRELQGVLKLADIEGYTVNVAQGWDFCWVRQCFANWKGTILTPQDLA